MCLRSPGQALTEVGEPQLHSPGAAWTTIGGSISSPGQTWTIVAREMHSPGQAETLLVTYDFNRYFVDVL